MSPKGAVALVIALVVIVLTAASIAYFLSQPRTISLNGIDQVRDEEQLVQSLPEVEVNTEDEADVIRAFYLDCQADSYNKQSFINGLAAKSPVFAGLRVSLGSQPDFANPGQFIDTYDSAPEALALIANQFEVDPRVMATLIELETGGLTLPTNDPQFPLGYPDPEGAEADFQIQVGIASEFISQQIEILRENSVVVQQKTLTAQAVLNYLAEKQYSLERIRSFMDTSSPNSFVRVFESNFGIDPRVCRN